MLITDGRIGTDDKNPTRIGIVLLHPRIGVALIEIAPRWTPGAVGRFCRRLDRAQFHSAHPGYLPIVHRQLRPDALQELPRLLVSGFAEQPPLHLTGSGDWVRSVRRILLEPLPDSLPSPVLPLPDSLPFPPARQQAGSAAGSAWAVLGGICGAAALGALLVLATRTGLEAPDIGRSRTLASLRPQTIEEPLSQQASPAGSAQAPATGPGEPRPQPVLVEWPAAAITPEGRIAPLADAMMPAPGPSVSVSSLPVEPEAGQAPATGPAEGGLADRPHPGQASAEPMPRPVFFAGVEAVWPEEGGILQAPLPSGRASSSSGTENAWAAARLAEPSPAEARDAPPGSGPASGAVAPSDEAAASRPPAVPTEEPPLPEDPPPSADGRAAAGPPSPSAAPEAAPVDVAAPQRPDAQPGTGPPAAAGSEEGTAGLRPSEGAPVPQPPPSADAVRSAAPAPPAPQPLPAASPALQAPAEGAGTADPAGTTGPQPPPAGATAALLRRGHALLALGDISAARRFFERAALAGSAEAALAAGGTYDPGVLATLRVSGIQPDPAAAAWYRRAAALGAAEAAAARLAALQAHGTPP